MTRRTWSALDDTVLRALYGSGASIADIATFMMCNKKAVSDRADALGLGFGRHHRWTAAEDEVLRKRYPDETAKDVARALSVNINQVYRRARTLNLSKSAAFLASNKSARIQRWRRDPRMQIGQFKKGHIPANKGMRRPGYAPGRMASTQFKKGKMSGAAARNYVPIGTEKVDKKRNVLMRKVTDDPTIFPVQRWRPVHVLVWEAAHGPVPNDGRIVVFKKGLKTFVATEITVDCLELVTLAENMRRNTIHNYPQPIPQLVQLRGVLNRKINRRSKA